jgi:hypothetical protein
MIVCNMLQNVAAQDGIERIVGKSNLRDVHPNHGRWIGKVGAYIVEIRHCSEPLSQAWLRSEVEQPLGL